MSSELLIADWNALAPHYGRGGLFLVEASLLETVIHLAAEDRAQDLEPLIASGQVRRPTPDEVADFSTTGEVFQFGIVQPFVFARRFVPQ